MTDAPEVLDRADGRNGELVLRRAGDDLEVISNGTFLMDTRDGRSERALVREALDRQGAARDLLVGGLGVGFSLLEAVEVERLTRIDVVEIEPVLVRWHAEFLSDRTGAALADPRVRVVQADVLAHLATGDTAYDVVCLDVDNGPEWTVTESNAGLYDAVGLASCLVALRPGGVLAVWSAAESAAYERLLRAHLDDVEVVRIAAYVERGGPDVVYLGRRPS